MFSIKEPQPLQNDKCFSCKFCLWDDERKQYYCDIKGCYNNSCFVKYELYR